MRRSKAPSAGPDEDSGGESHAGTGFKAGRPGASTEQTVRAAAVGLLARREHSLAELRVKLLRRHPEALVEAVIAQLAAKNLVSDGRFTANFIHHHARRGQGPLRIRSELRQQGIADAAITQALADADVDWAGTAAAVRQRKFGANRPKSLTERAKQSRFLQYRGFDGDQIRAALNSATGESLPESEDSAGQVDAGFDLDLDS